MPKLRLLVVDDHAVFRRVVCALLSKEPTLDVICQTASGEDAVKKAAELHPDRRRRHDGLRPQPIPLIPDGRPAYPRAGWPSPSIRGDFH